MTVFEVAKGKSLFNIEWKDMFTRTLLDREYAVVKEVTPKWLGWFLLRQDFGASGLQEMSEVDWWSNPYACFYHGRLSKLALTHADRNPIFRVYGFRKGDQAACGVNLFAVKVALETYLRAGWAKKAALSIELDNKVMVNWILNPSQRPWGVARSMVEIDKLVCECVTVHFRSVALQDLTMAVTLAQDGIDKRDW
ncbi:hypothetical protein V6N13_102983 [Hibiscus sabdariffa]